MSATRPVLARAVGAVLLAATLVSCSSNARPGNTSDHFSVGPGLAGVGELPRPASDWPSAGFDARHSSATSATGPQTAHVRWTRRLEGDVTPGPVLARDGTILAASNAGVLHDLDPRTGKDVWTYDGGGSYGSDLSTSPAVVAGGVILWPGPGDRLVALDPAGHRLWSEQFDGQVLSPAVAGNNRVYVADLAGHLTAIEVIDRSHRRLWRLRLGGTDYAGATVGPDGTIYTAADQDLVAVRDLGRTGAVRWRFHARKLVEVSNAVGPDGTVLLGTNHDKQFGITPRGDAAWAVDIGDYTYSSSVVRPDGLGYFGDNMGRVRVVDTSNGKVEHTIAPLGAGAEKVWTSVAVDARGNFYWASTAGNVYGYRPDGTRLFRLGLDGGSNSYPALGGDGTLYLGSTAGTFYAIGG